MTTRARLGVVRVDGPGWSATMVCPGWSVNSIVEEFKRMGVRGSVEDGVIVICTDVNREVWEKRSAS